MVFPFLRDFEGRDVIDFRVADFDDFLFGAAAALGGFRHGDPGGRRFQVSGRFAVGYPVDATRPKRKRAFDAPATTTIRIATRDHCRFSKTGEFRMKDKRKIASAKTWGKAETNKLRDQNAEFRVKNTLYPDLKF